MNIIGWRKEQKRSDGFMRCTSGLPSGNRKRPCSHERSTSHPRGKKRWQRYAYSCLLIWCYERYNCKFLWWRQRWQKFAMCSQITSFWEKGIYRMLESKKVRREARTLERVRKRNLFDQSPGSKTDGGHTSGQKIFWYRCQNDRDASQCLRRFSNHLGSAHSCRCKRFCSKLPHIPNS